MKLKIKHILYSIDDLIKRLLRDESSTAFIWRFGFRVGFLALEIRHDDAIEIRHLSFNHMWSVKAYHRKSCSPPRLPFSRTDLAVGKGGHTAEVAGKGSSMRRGGQRQKRTFAGGLLRPNRRRCGQTERGGIIESQMTAAQQRWLEWLTKGSMMPMRAAIFSCA